MDRQGRRGGRALYLFQADKNGTSACSGACAAAWPPDTVTGTPQAGSGVSQSLLGTITRADGAMQLTYNGHPLYYVAADTAAGTAHRKGSWRPARNGTWSAPAAARSTPADREPHAPGAGQPGQPGGGQT